MSVERVWIGETAYVPDIARWVEPGDTVEFDEPPENPLFVTPTQARKHTSRKANTADDESEEQ